MVPLFNFNLGSPLQRSSNHIAYGIIQKKNLNIFLEEVRRQLALTSLIGQVTCICIAGKTSWATGHIFFQVPYTSLGQCEKKWSLLQLAI